MACLTLLRTARCSCLFAAQRTGFCTAPPRSCCTARKMTAGVLCDSNSEAQQAQHAAEPAQKKLKPGSADESLRVKKLSDKAVLPKRRSDGAAGYDLSSAEDCVVPARGKYMVNTDITIAIPSTCYGRVAPRSGLAWKHSIDTGAGVIDCDYRGPLKVILFNFSDTDFQIKQGDRIAQLILERIMTPEVIETDDLDSTTRGAGGLGSTGGFGKQ